MCHADLFPIPLTTQSTFSPGSSYGTSANTGMRDSALRDSARLPGLVATYYNGIPILESSVCTSSIVGTTVASPTVLSYQGASQILFTFSVCESFTSRWSSTHSFIVTGYRREARWRILLSLPCLQRTVSYNRGHTISNRGRVLWRAVQGLHHERLSRAARIHGPHQGIFACLC